jgi:hypothetical protein
LCLKELCEQTCWERRWERVSFRKVKFSQHLTNSDWHSTCLLLAEESDWSYLSIYQSIYLSNYLPSSCKLNSKLMQVCSSARTQGM